ncbi:MAG: hypothetical protein CMD18_08855 [Flavobacteriales bacterium]|nr:hypothetical protein [Flavobacteriales bacterium]
MNIYEKIKSFSKNSESVKLISLEEVNNFNLQSYEDFIIGATVRYGKLCKSLFLQTKKHLKKKSDFFSVNVVARKLEIIPQKQILLCKSLLNDYFVFLDK